MQPIDLRHQVVILVNTGEKSETKIILDGLGPMANVLTWTNSQPIKLHGFGLLM